MAVIRSYGICGLDLHSYRDDINYAIRTPVVIPHEFSENVVEKGPGVGKNCGEEVFSYGKIVREVIRTPQGWVHGAEESHCHGPP